MNAMRHFRAPAALLRLLVLGALSGCSGRVTQAGGLEVIVTTNMSIPQDFSFLHVVVRQQLPGVDGGWAPPIADVPLQLTSQASLPARISVAAGSSPDQVALIEVSGTQADGTVVVTQQAELQVPTNRVAELVLFLAAICRDQSCEADETCNPLQGGCKSAQVEVGNLPDYLPGDEGRLDASEPDVSQSGSPDATLDGAIEAGSSTDATFEAALADALASDSGGDAPGNTTSDAANCVNVCTAGTSQCGNGVVQSCRVQSTGCTDWSTTQTCGAHQSCSSGDAGAACTCDATICNGVGKACEDSATLATCTADANGCMYVSATSACPSPQTCGGTAPNGACSLTCSNSCGSGQASCVTGGLATCTLGSNGCWSLGQAAPCAGAHQSCSGAALSATCTCNSDAVCHAAGSTCANATTLATCTKDPQGCFYESASSACTGGMTCQGSACACATGEVECSGTCTNPLTDNANCGNCNSPCPGTSTCSGGKCLCSGTDTLCGNACVNTSSAAANCGSCGHSCGSSTLSAGQCVASKCQPFNLQTVGPLTPPLLIDTSVGSLYATLDGDGVAAVSTADGALSQVSAGLPGTVFAQDAANLYMGASAGGGGPLEGEILSIAKSGLAVTPLTNSLSSYSTYLWIGVVPGSATPLCAHWSGAAGPPSGWNDLACGSTAGLLGTSLDTCGNDPSLNCFTCAGPNGSSGTCTPSPPVAVAADANGLVWADSMNFNFVSSANLTASPSSFALPQSATPTAMVLDAKNVYWVDSNGLVLYRTTRAGGVSTIMQYLEYVPVQLAVDTNNLYWANTAGAAIMTLPTTAIQTGAPATLASGAGEPTGIAVDATAVYWINSEANTVMKLMK